MLTLLLIISIIPPAPRVTANSNDYLEIQAPPQLCYDVMIAFANVVEPNWRGNAFPIWASLAQDAKDNGRICYSWSYYDEKIAYRERELFIGLALHGYKYKYENKTKTHQ